MRDITDLRKLEEVRTDFVANVSHELKTPITSIKGFIETLSSDDFEHNKETKKFLEIIRQQSNRLNTIVDDLLTLSRIERKEEHIVFDLFPLENIIKNSIALCHHQAEKKNIKIKMNCDSNSEIKVITINKKSCKSVAFSAIIPDGSCNPNCHSFGSLANANSAIKMKHEKK